MRDYHDESHYPYERKTEGRIERAVIPSEKVVVQEQTYMLHRPQATHMEWMQMVKVNRKKDCFRDCD